MKFLHTADLHIGKSIYECSMLEDQRHIMQEILQIAKEEEIDGMLLAGDIYDRSVPATEAVELLEWFLLEALKIAPVFMISGNHDSAKRLSFGASLFEKNGLYIAGGTETKTVVLKGKDSETIGIHMLPFVKPAVVEAANAQEAVQKQLEKLKENRTEGKRNILMTHFFVCAGKKEPELSDSEEKTYVGGLEQVDVSLFADYDYVALGHIHKPQAMKKGQTYYAGSPLCYSFSEAVSSEETGKGVYILEVPKQGEVKISRRVLHPLHRMRIIKGSLAELLKQGSEEKEASQDYIQAILTDKEELIDPIGTLRSVYPNTMQIVLEKRLAEGKMPLFQGAERKAKTIPELFMDFYETLAGEPMDEAREAVVKAIAGEIEDRDI